ncbi:cobaltochelatase subunit CobN [Halocynthiibacter namhaensis]|uniref:cobaltochelatase subunit CobN n=1 Tax=Halocynthiibacter namhaensis TaxID=1290553 RepID=UPI000579798E|nr:cobaltochelatase subunit CobN [Halocynthiibacter namhaensis]
MHVVFRESHGLEETETPMDLGQTPADLVVLSFSDSDLGAFAAGWQRGKANLPQVRLANIVALKHPLSVDTYVEQTLTGVKGILIRLIGGESYWSYGLMQIQDHARRNGIALAILPADGRADARLDELSTLPVSTLRRLQQLCDAGGAVAAQAALAQLALAAGLYAGPVPGSKIMPEFGFYHPDHGVVTAPEATDRPLVLVSFYRSYLTSADTNPVDALIAGLEARGYHAVGVFASSLKAPEASNWIKSQLQTIKPAAIINATAFSAKGADGAASPLNATDCPVFQVGLSTARKSEWGGAHRGLSPADLAMHVVLPEVDGRIFLGVISFKSPGPRDEDLQYSRFIHRADPCLITQALDRVSGWLTVQDQTIPKRCALILSTYPGKDYQIAHAVGLDAIASANNILKQLQQDGQDTAPITDFGKRLGSERVTWSLDAYKTALAGLPQQMQDDLQEVWGAPDADPLFQNDAFQFPAIRTGQILVALQPERGQSDTRVDDYHDMTRTPRHSYVAFYLWLQTQIEALVHIGAHGTLEWLPGKAVALSNECWPQILTGNLPVIYPFIVNDPGEAAQAKRRIGAVTLGHLPPPLVTSETPDNLTRLEGLLDEYSTADGLDPARRDRLIDDIQQEAQSNGLAADLGLGSDCSAAEALTRIDAFVCDIKESQYGDGLHIFGTGDCGEAEKNGLRQALAGKFVAAGPSGSPFRGREDVLPTGRNLFTTDPRAVPSRSAHAQGVKLAEELLRRHLQDHGDWPKSLVIDLWGSATMRTAGEELAMAMHLAGLAPKWDENSERVGGYDILPLALLGRPRIDVTLRVSGLFRDVFPGLAQLFETAAQALGDRDEDPANNPYLAKGTRVFGPRPGQYGLNMGANLDDFTEEARQAAGEAWLEASSYPVTANGDASPERGAIEARVLAADGFVHLQDMPETDVLLASDYAAHEAGFAAAVKALGGQAPALYHLDATRPDQPKARLLSEEIARVVRGRAANADWANGMMRHGFRGAAEITATLDHLAAFSHLASVVPAHLFDLYFDATLGRDDLVDFMQEANPQALAALQDRFRELADAGLWVTRRNSISAQLDDLT